MKCFVKTIIILLLVVVASECMFAQTTYLVPMSGDTTIMACGGNVCDPGGPNGNYPSGCNGYIVIYPTNTWGRVQLIGTYDIGSSDYAQIYDGVGTGGILLETCIGTGSVSITSNSGPITILFNSTAGYYWGESYPGFDFAIWCFGGRCGSFGPQVNLTPNEDGVLVSWPLAPDSTTTTCIVEYGPAGFEPGTGIQELVFSNNIQLSGLAAYATYDIYVYFDCDNDGVVTTEVPTIVSYCVPGGFTCMDFSDLNAPNITCTSGTFSNPYQTIGVVDYGPADIMSRHTLNTVQSTDPRTDNQLNVLPPCENYSVRLGNWKNGSQGESISYDFQVDTAVADIILLKYAAVLQNPSHSASTQPRFRFEILNQNNQLIDPQCGSADFVASVDLGWNQCNGGSLLWKDWTTVGSDVSAYHGQTIRVRLTTYDCNHGGHYGYAYFTLNCKKKAIVAETCGESMTSTYTAPLGFDYRWYYQSDPSTTISTDQSATVAIVGGSEALCCWCSSIGNPNCGFEMSTSLTSRYPLARFSVTRDSCTRFYTFNNESTISNDGVNPLGTDERCELYYWDFGDGTTSMSVNPSHEYPNPGTYEVTLIATINHDRCQDTIRDTVVVLPNVPVITGNFNICSGDTTTLYASGGLGMYEWLEDTTVIATGDVADVHPADTTTFILRSYDYDGCFVDTAQEIVVHFPQRTQLYDSICLGEDYSAYGFTFPQQNTLGTVTDRHMLQTQYGCDSLVSIEVFVKNLPNTIFDTTIPYHCFWLDGPIEITAPDATCESYLWSTGETTPTISISSAGTYTVTSTLHGCSKDGQFSVQDMCIYDPILPNVMTPNGDNVNDVFIVKNMDPNVPNHLTIYNRWGTKVYDKENYQTYCLEGENDEVHNPTEGFTAEGLSDGVFFYVFHYEDAVKSIDFHGTVTVIRGTSGE